MSYSPTAENFAKSYQEDIAQVVWTTLVADLETPVSAMLKLADGRANTFLLESVEGGNKWTQYSIIGLDCHDYFKISGNEVISFENNQQTSLCSESPLDLIKEKIEKYNCAKFDDLPRFFGGYVGFFAYESSKYAEKRIESLKEKPSKFDENMPDIYLVKAKKISCFR